MTLQAKSYDLRLRVLDMVYRAKTGHIGGDFSVCDILNVLYNKVMDVTPENFSTVDRDHFILSKATRWRRCTACSATRAFSRRKIWRRFPSLAASTSATPTTRCLASR